MNIDFFIKNATDFFLEVELNPEHAKEFEEKYHSIANEKPILGNGYQHQPNKWGTECRVYFNSKNRNNLNHEFSLLNINIDQGRRAYKDKYMFRVNNNDFFWALVGKGYRLGEN